MKKGRVKTAGITEKVWKTMHAALATLTLRRQIWLLKHISGYCATGKKMKLWKKRDTDECPLCGIQEDHHHIITCPSVSAQQRWDQLYQKLSQKLICMGSPPHMHKTVLHIMKEYRLGRQTMIAVDSPLLQQALRKQFEIGWACFAEGLLVCEWAEYVKTFINPKRSPTLWIQELIVQLWDMLKGMWDNQCQQLHTKDLRNKLHNMTNVDRRIIQICSQTRASLRPHERVLFQRIPETLSHHTPRYRRLWLQRAEQIIKATTFRCSQTTYLHSERRLMQRWLGRSFSHQPPPQSLPKYTRQNEDKTQTTLRSWVHNSHTIPFTD